MHLHCVTERSRSEDDTMWSKSWPGADEWLLWLRHTPYDWSDSRQGPLLCVITTLSLSLLRFLSPLYCLPSNKGTSYQQINKIEEDTSYWSCCWTLLHAYRWGFGRGCSETVHIFHKVLITGAFSTTSIKLPAGMLQLESVSQWVSVWVTVNSLTVMLNVNKTEFCSFQLQLGVQALTSTYCWQWTATINSQWHRGNMIYTVYILNITNKKPKYINKCSDELCSLVFSSSGDSEISSVF